MKKIKGNNLMNIAELKEKKISELTQMAKQLKVEGAAGMRKQELMFALLQSQIEKNGLIFGEGRHFGDFTGRFRLLTITGFQLPAGSG
jgi:transcription termination factor Rho